MAFDDPTPPQIGHGVAVLVELPKHAGLNGVLSYRTTQPLAAGQLLRVPLGRRVVCGIAWGDDASGGAPQQGLGAAPTASDMAAPVLRDVAEALDALPPLDAAWRDLVTFAAAYYQRSTGELALSVLPADLRELDGPALQRRLRRLDKRLGRTPPSAPKKRRGKAVPEDEVTPDPVPPPDIEPPALPDLSDEQQAVLDALAACGAEPVLLHGVTGSGKTEVYLRRVAAALEAGRQALLLVPEINLTPQLEARIRARFPGRVTVAMHSGLGPAERLQNWLAAHLGWADIVLGTRMAVFASMPRLGLIVVDEEHDPSYKQQEGARYSARDLAVWRARHQGVAVILGSATPSLETWHNALPVPEGNGRYRRLAMPTRIGAGVLPQVRLIDLTRLKEQFGAKQLRDQPFAPPLLAALRERLDRGEQSLVLLNRRGYAPVLHCTACGWKSDCPHCSAWRVFHKLDRTLRCHHCGHAERVPRACPSCGDPDIQPVGRGTERLEEQLAAALPGARIGRIDADTTRAKGSLEAQLAQVHDGDIDVLVGTQMVAKGHDFRRITLVASLQADAALFSSDFRAPERLFALLMQAGGRAGRDAAQAARSELWIQTWHPQHPLYAALTAHDYPTFAAGQLLERQQAGLPPFAHLALLRCEARTQEAAVAFLAELARRAAELQTQQPAWAAILVYPPVPPSVQRVANVERAQMLVESPSRPALQRFLAAWLPSFQDEARQPGTRVLRWAVDVDPLAI
ncbi:primosomal protein N' [Sphaerotilus mobilis]|uniref:Replication restart protein PriA n=1 Tax=Sphaerotilus mobilis TaxID=47994 RepID=A0A4Q7LHH7_9BURK|nr:primosomal protein N' [Sphaerotilus mobilis]RZS53187.1 replication restart DNA helicase PriA [Sphaerotilus mobilis]